MSLQEQTAWIVHEKRMYWARGSSRLGHPTSAVVLLLQGLFDQFKDHSFFILRNRIYLNYQPSEMDLGMLKLVAKRWSIGEFALTQEVNAVEISAGSDGFFVPTLDRRPCMPSRKQIKSRTDAEGVLQELEAQIPRTGDLHDQSRKIAAVLTDEFGDVLQASVHQGSINKTLHAEVDLLQEFSRRQQEFRSGFRLYVSMKPCHMCAGMIHQCGIKNVFYQHDDPGPKARGTILDKMAVIEPLHSR